MPSTLLKEQVSEYLIGLPEAPKYVLTTNLALRVTPARRKLWSNK